jgi:predicted PhzF superfamily epimerase YddE/YHI9
LGVKPKEFLAARDYFCVFETEAEVRALKPNMEKLAAIGGFGTIVTAPGSDCDFVSRFFAPAQGVNEDPVTGSSHCTLIPYWSARLNKTKLFARQISARGGELWCEHRGDRVTISGNAVKFLEGTIHVE